MPILIKIKSNRNRSVYKLTEIVIIIYISNIKTAFSSALTDKENAEVYNLSIDRYVTEPAADA